MNGSGGSLTALTAENDLSSFFLTINFIPDCMCPFSGGLPKSREYAQYYGMDTEDGPSETIFPSCMTMSRSKYCWCHSS